MKLAIIGSSGVIGRHLLPRLEARGHEIKAPKVDIFDRNALSSVLSGVDAVINLASRVPRLEGSGGTEYGMNDRIRREGIASLIDACGKTGVRRLVQQSIAFMMAGGGRVMTELSPENPTPVAASAIDMESQLKASDLDWIVLRDGLLYGPGTGREKAWREALQKRQPIPGAGDDYMSLVHVADLAEAFVAALGAFRRAARVDRIFAIVDDRPLTYRELFDRLAAHNNLSPLRAGGQLRLPSFRVSNARAVEQLGWKPFYRTVWSGLAC
jgi:nucleoside-diphosphate-sugar epimerase